MEASLKKKKAVNNSWPPFFYSSVVNSFISSKKYFIFGMVFSNFSIFSFAVFLSVVAAIGLQYSFFNVSFDHVPIIT